jgi:hypothetical protein
MGKVYYLTVSSWILLQGQGSSAGGCSRMWQTCLGVGRRLVLSDQLARQQATFLGHESADMRASTAAALQPAITLSDCIIEPTTSIAMWS